MSDRELLELAGKAAGLKLKFRALTNMPGCIETCFSVDAKGATERWNPIERDGDALRLAVKLHLDIRFYWDGCEDQYDTVEAYTHGAKKDAQEQIGFYLNCGQLDEMAATRRAIVRAAAEIGRSMP